MYLQKSFFILPIPIIDKGFGFSIYFFIFLKIAIIHSPSNITKLQFKKTQSFTIILKI